MNVYTALFHASKADETLLFIALSKEDLEAKVIAHANAIYEWDAFTNFDSACKGIEKINNYTLRLEEEDVSISVSKVQQRRARRFLFVYQRSNNNGGTYPHIACVHEYADSDWSKYTDAQLLANFKRKLRKHYAEEMTWPGAEIKTEIVLESHWGER